MLTLGNFTEGPFPLELDSGRGVVEGGGVDFDFKLMIAVPISAIVKLIFKTYSLARSLSSSL